MNFQSIFPNERENGKPSPLPTEQELSDKISRIRSILDEEDKRNMNIPLRQQYEATVTQLFHDAVSSLRACQIESNNGNDSLKLAREVITMETEADICKMADSVFGMYTPWAAESTRLLSLEKNLGKDVFRSQYGDAYERLQAQSNEMIASCEACHQQSVDLYNALMPAWTTAAAFRSVTVPVGSDLPLSLTPLDKDGRISDGLSRADAVSPDNADDLAAEEIFTVVDNVCAALSQIAETMIQMEEQAFAFAMNGSRHSNAPNIKLFFYITIFALICAVIAAAVAPHLIVI